MNDVAAVWIKSLKDATTKSWAELKAEFNARFGKNTADNSDQMQAVWTAKQNTSEPVRNYYDRIISMAADLDMSEQLLTSAIQAGLNSAIKQFVARKQPKSLKELLDFATLAESTDYNTFDTALPEQSCPRVTFLGPDPTRPGETLTRPDPTRESRQKV